MIIILFIIPVTMPEGNNWLGWADFPPSILNGGSSFTQFTSNDWKDAMTWLKENTPEDAIIASWWDYGYWITTLSDRTTLADNATLNDWQIKKIAYTLITNPENSWHILSSEHTEDISEYLGDENVIAWGGNSYSEWLSLNEDNKNCTSVSITEAKESDIDQKICFPVGQGLDADYLVIYIVGERFYIQDSNIPLYTLEGGGDESKKTWYAAISNHQVSKYVQDDNITPTDYYMEKSTLGLLTPFSIFTYVEPNTGRTFDDYSSGFIPVYVAELKLKDPENDPFYLVYASPSFYNQQPGPMSTVLIYKINHDYNS